MEATITLPSAWPGLEHRDGLSAARLARNERAALVREDIRDELEAEMTKAMRGEQQFVPGVVSNGYIDSERLQLAADVVVESIREDKPATEAFREVMQGSRCAHVTVLRQMIQSRLMADLSESVLSALDWHEVAHQLMAALRMSVCGQVNELREVLADEYVKGHAERIADAREHQQ